MITAIQIENFKCIRDRVRVELKPITLLFGANSSGKSTIVQAIHYAREIFERHDLDPERTVLGGDILDLGGFRNFVHNHDTTRVIRMRFEVDLTSAELPQYWDEYSGDQWASDVDVSRHMEALFQRCSSAWVEIGVFWLGEWWGALVKSYTVALNGQRIAATEFRHDKDYLEALIDYRGFMSSENDRRSIEQHPSALLSIDWAHPLLADDGVQWFREIFGELVAEESILDDRLRVRFRGQFPQLIPSALPKWDQFIQIEGYQQGKANREHDYVERWSALLFGLSRMVVGPGQLVRNELRKFRYLGPLREMPRRSYEPPHLADDSRWANGLAAWDALYQADEHVFELPNESSEKEPTAAEIAEDECSGDASSAGGAEDVAKLLIEKVNEWLVGRLKAGYTVRRRSHAEVDTQAIPEGSADPKELVRFVEELKERATKKRVVLVPDGQSIEVQPHDVGTGISQLLPVVVLALDSERNLIAIEQPELHLHPALQAELGDLFIESALGERKNTFILETHSEHLILRIMRRMRDTVRKRRGDAPPVTPNDVAVLFVDSTPEGCVVRELRLKPDGSLLDPWPRGFFEESFTELFG